MELEVGAIKATEVLKLWDVPCLHCVCSLVLKVNKVTVLFLSRSLEVTVLVLVLGPSVLVLVLRVTVLVMVLVLRPGVLVSVLVLPLLSWSHGITAKQLGWLMKTFLFGS